MKKKGGSPHAHVRCRTVLATGHPLCISQRLEDVLALSLFEGCGGGGLRDGRRFQFTQWRPEDHRGEDDGPFNHLCRNALDPPRV